MLRENVALSILNSFIIKVGTQASAVKLTLQHVNNSSLTPISYNIRNIGDIDLIFAGQSVLGK
jgi:hypothetical protein